MKHKILTLALSLILLFGFASPAFAQGSGGDQVVFGHNYTLDDGEELNGNLVVFGGNVEISEKSQINGDLVVIGGNARVEGTITGDVQILGGNVNLEETAEVKGDINALGGNVNQAEGAQVKGDVERIDQFGNNDDDDEQYTFGPPDFPNPPEAPYAPSRSGFFNYLFYAIEDTARDITWIIGIALIGWLVAAFLPQRIQTVGDTIVQTPVISFGMGVLTAILGAIVVTILTLTICLTVISVPLAILLIMGALFGWIVVGQIIGERLLTSIERPLPNVVVATVVGVVILTALSTMPVIGFVPIVGWILGFVGWLFGMIVMFTGLGGVILTRYGTRPYLPGDAPFGGGGGPAHGPYTPPNPSAAIDRLTAAEAELKAKIKAALAEADRQEAESGPTEPEPDTPTEEPPAEDQPKPKRKPAAKKPKKEEKPADDIDPADEPAEPTE